LNVGIAAVDSFWYFLPALLSSEHFSGEYLATTTKADLAQIVASDLGLTKFLAKRLVDCCVEALSESVARGDRIELRGLGAFTVRVTNAKPNARNPRTGDVVNVPARRKVHFRPGKLLKEALKQPLASPG